MVSKKVIDTKYQQWLAELKEKIRNSQMKAALKVNTEMLSLYWEIGKELNEKLAQSNWGDKIITQLAKDLLSEFPGVKGFSATNLKYIRKWYRFYNAIGQQAVDQLETGITKTSKKISQQPVDQIIQRPVELMPEFLSRVPWGHHIQIITKVNNIEEAIFYVKQTAISNWSRAVLLHQVESGLYRRKGKAITNFGHTLPKAQSDLARETLKSPYLFDFLGLTEEVQERELEKALIQHLKKFMLELGRGFAYVGNQYNLNVGGDDFFLDLLFYNYLQHRFVVFELKVGDFEPEFTGKLNLYINTIDEQIKGEDDKPSIGVLLCRTPNETMVKYALKGIDTPMGVAEYEFTKALPKQLKGEMPTIEELEQEIEKEIEILRKPINEKKNKLKEILNRIKMDEVKKEKDNESLLYLFDEVLWKIKEYAESILKEEMALFREAWIERSINGSSNRYLAAEDLKAKLSKENIYNIGLYLRMDGLVKAGTKAFGISMNLHLELDRYKYTIGENRDVVWQEYLYHYKWSEDELRLKAERWCEIIIDEIARRAEQAI